MGSPTILSVSQWGGAKLGTHRDSESGAEGLSGVCVSDNEVEEDHRHGGLDRFDLPKCNTLCPPSVYCHVP
jgi:hypothetical protein